MRIHEFEPTPDLGVSVLIVEDQTSDVVGPYALLSHLGYRIGLAFDGEQALIEVTRTPYELVILDWNLPICSGGEFLNQVSTRWRESSQDRSRSPLNVICYSGEELDPDRFSGAVGYRVLDIWTKPMPPLEILHRLKKLKEDKWRDGK